MKYINNLELDVHTFFLANNSDLEFKNRPLSFIFDLLRYTLWQFKLKKEIPNYTLQPVKNVNFRSLTADTFR